MLYLNLFADELPSRYDIYQQGSVKGCHLLPFLNRRKLQEQPHTLVTQYNSIETLYNENRKWQESIHALLSTPGPLQDLYNTWKQDGIVLPVFEENGRQIPSFCWKRPLESLMITAFMPINLFDLQVLLRKSKRSLATQTPYLRLKCGKHFILQGNKFSPLSESEQQDVNKIYEQGKLEVFETPIDDVYFLGANFLGDVQHVFFFTAMFKVVCHVHGLNCQNKDFEHYADVQRCFKGTVWENLDKRVFLEHRIAQILQEDSTLKNEAIQVVDIIFPMWSSYMAVKNGRFYDSPDKHARKNLKDKMAYVPCEELMLAYYLTCNARFLYSLSISQELFYIIFETGWTKRQAQLFNFVFDNLGIFGAKTYRQRALGQQSWWQKLYQAPPSVYFTKVWQDIIGRIHPDPQEYYVSVNAHGYLMQFSDIDRQKREDNELAKALGFLIWDSNYAGYFDPPYKHQGSLDDIVEFPACTCNGDFSYTKKARCVKKSGTYLKAYDVNLAIKTLEQ